MERELEQKICNVVRGVLAEICDRPHEDIQYGYFFSKDLNMDSLDVIEACSIIEEKLVLPESSLDYNKVQTVGQLIEQTKEQYERA